MSNILKILAKVFGFPEKFLGEWQEEFEITENDFDKPNYENDVIYSTKISSADFNIDIKNEVDLDSIEKGLSHPIIIPLKPKKSKPNDVKETSQGVRQFKCEICDACFMKKINLKRHIKVHEKAKPYNFGTSDATFTSKGIMKNHKATVHGGQKQNIHFDFAPTENTSVYLIEQNSKKSVTNPRRRSCTYCDQTFSNKGNLNRHVRTDHERKKFSCTECPKQFSRNLSLKCHFNDQHAEDPVIYHCDFCHKEWTHYEMFKKHKNCAPKPDKRLNKKSKKKN